MKWLLLAAAWIAYGAAFCLTTRHDVPADTDDDFIITHPIDQASTDNLLIRDILHGLDFNIYLDDLNGLPWEQPNSDSAFILKGLLP